MKKNLLLRVEELILFALILLNLFEFTGSLSSELSYIKKIISYTVLGYLLYRASLSSVFFGKKEQNFDFLIVFAFFLLAFKNVFIISLEALDKATFFKTFFYLLVQQGPLFELIGFYVGTIMLIALAIYSGIKFKIKNPSLMSVLHEKNKERNVQKIVVNYLVFLAFFLFIFNLAFEWLAITIDAPIISLAFFVYVFLALTRSKLDPESTLFKIGNYGERFYDYFIGHFKYKEKLLLGVAGMLILHMLTDIGVFLIPFVLGLKNSLYLPILESGHEPLITLVMEVSSNTWQFLGVFVQYLLSTIGFTLAMILPAIMWHNLYFRKKLHINRVVTALFYSGISAFAFTPILHILPLKPEFFVGVDIITTAVSINPWPALVVSTIVFLTVFFLGKTSAKTPIIALANIGSLVFFLWYVLNFFLSTINWYRIAAFNLLQTNHIFIGIHFFLFLILTIIFYIGGYYTFIRSILKRRVTIT